jgi:hypothetical protein
VSIQTTCKNRRTAPAKRIEHSKPFRAASLDIRFHLKEGGPEHAAQIDGEELTARREADLTRVATFMMAREASMKTYPDIGITTPHHTISHHGGKPDVIKSHATLNTYHVSLFAKFVEKLSKTPDGDGTLLDHSTLFYGSGMSNANVHGPYPLPLVAVGGGVGKGHRHIVTPEHTPLGNLWVTVAEMYGCDGESFGESTGSVDFF